MKTLLLNREFKLPADGWYQIVPFGEFPVSDEAGKRLVQVVDAPAAQAICNRFAEAAQQPGFAGILVDYDHFSLDTDKSSAAAGWITTLENRADGVYAQIRWTIPGEEKVKGGEFRFCSPVFNRADCQDLGGGRVRPLALLNLALTNDHNMKTLKPLSNRAGTSAGADATPPETGRKEPSMKQIATALGLPETATEADCLGKIQEIKSGATAATTEAETLKNRVTTLETAELAAQVEADLTAHAAVIDPAKREDVKAALLSNRAQGLKLLAALKPAGTLPNRRDATSPADAGADAAAVADSARAAKIRNRAAELQASNRWSHDRAFSAAEKEFPV